jgi:hypothetical protein
LEEIQNQILLDKKKYKKKDWNWPKIELKLNWNWTEIELKLNWNWTKIELKLNWNWTEIEQKSPNRKGIKKFKKNMEKKYDWEKKVIPKTTI